VKNSSKIREFANGWRALLASSLGNASGLSGLPFYTFGVFVVPLSDAFGWSRGQVSSAASFLILGTAITAPIVGSIIDRIGARRVALWSLFALSLGYAGLTRLASNIALFYSAWMLMSLAGGGTTPVVWTRAVNLWFDRSRGLALGLTLAGSGLAGVFGPVFCSTLIERYGWAGGYLGLSAFILLISIPVVFLLYKERSTPVAPAGAQSAAAHELPGLSFRQALRTAAYWKIAGGFLLVSGAIAGLVINLVPLMLDRGMSAMDAASIAGAMGVAVLVGRVVVGFLLDKFSAPLVGASLLCATAVGCLLMTLSAAPTWVLVLSILSLGLATAAEVDLVAFLVSRYFGMKAYGRIYGSQLTAFYLGAAFGPALMGFAYDHYSGYTQILHAVTVIFVFGAAVVGTLGPLPDFDDRSQRAEERPLLDGAVAQPASDQQA